MKNHESELNYLHDFKGFILQVKLNLFFKCWPDYLNHFIRTVPYMELEIRLLSPLENPL